MKPSSLFLVLLLLLHRSISAAQPSLTIYNQNFGVVRDTRRLQLGSGRVELSFKDVSSRIQPETVRLHSLTKGALFEVLEQNYRYDLLTPAKLLEKYVGKQISVYRYNERTGTEEKKAAEVLSVEGSLASRDAVGGTAPARVAEQLEAATERSAEYRFWVQG